MLNESVRRVLVNRTAVLTVCFLFCAKESGEHQLCMCPTLHSVYVVMCVSRRRQEREKLAVAGVPEVWGLSPPPPELE